MIFIKNLLSTTLPFCGMSHPAMPDDVIQNTPTVYYRFHGVPDLYRSRYSAGYLQKVVDAVHANPKTKESWFYFNNDVDTHAIRNAKEMLGMIKT